MTRRTMQAGAAGVILAALFYLPVSTYGGILAGFNPGPVEEITFFLLLALCLGELPLMAFGLRAMFSRAAVPSRIAHGAFGLYVAFAAIYAGIQVLLFGASIYSHALVGTCIIRWFSGFWIAGRDIPLRGVGSK